MTPLQIALCSALGGCVLLCLLAWLIFRFLTAPNKPRAGTDRLLGVELAHRGLHENPTLPENSLGAFQAAVDAGFGIELDVQLSSEDRKSVV